MRAGDLGVPFRLPLLILGFASLVTGVLAGLARLGWGMPLSLAQLSLLHGPLMVSGFLGTVIGLERAVAMGRRWGYAGPLLSGLGGAAILAGFPLAFGAAAMTLGSAVLCLGTTLIMLRQRELFMITMALGALSWLAGNLLWLAGAPVPGVAALWINFLVLTIAGERLELTRFLPPRLAASTLFAGLLTLVVVTTGLTAAGDLTGARAFGLGLLGLAVWLLRYDIARQTVRQTGLTRFVAVCLLSGYAWLAVGGLLGLAGGFDAGHPWRDAALHAVFLGFVFAMVIGHAPIIFPAVMRVKIPYHPVFYLPLVALHLSVLARVAGVLAEIWPLRQGAAIANGAALLLFVLTLLGRVLAGAVRREGTP